MLHRFLGIDNYIQDPTNTQNFNNYGYVFNNPLSNTDISGNSCDCPGGGINVGPGTQTGSSVDLEQLGKDTGIDKWMRKNLNFNSWGRSIGRWFGGGSSGPPPNVSKYGNIQMPTQHSSFGFNWTYLSEGKPGERFIYEFFNGFNTTGQYIAGRGVGDYSMRNLNGSATNTDEAVWGLVNAFSFATAVGELKAFLSELKVAKVMTNAKGVVYPKVFVEGFGEVPFPKGPFTPNNSKVLRGEFTPKLKTEFKDWWIQQGRPWPKVPEGSTLNVHHVQPLAHGGTNSFDNLIPLIQPEQHQPFTNWWRGF